MEYSRECSKKEEKTVVIYKILGNYHFYNRFLWKAALYLNIMNVGVIKMDEKFYESIKTELLEDILPYWEKYARDENPSSKGFYGDISNKNKQNKKISRSIVMTSRFLWTYSAAARLTKNADYLKMADFAYDVVKNQYFDKVYGGVYWSVETDGTPRVSKKQIYGEAFCCYGLCEYAAAIKEIRGDEALAKESMNKSLELFDFMEKYAFDSADGGYIEACAMNWSQTQDMQLSPKDMNCPKSMNTNLHVMEAYTNLYRTLPVVFAENTEKRAQVGNSLTNLVRVTVEKILQKNGHLGMFFDMKWNLLDEEISYGHDIEASWLLWEAACELGDDSLKNEIRPSVLNMADVALAEGFDMNTGAMENFMRGTKKDRTRVWWNQAESLNGFYNAWEMTRSQKFAEVCEMQWNWILNYQVDKKGGEWWSALTPKGRPITKESKGGNWKTSYHSGRACMELLRRSGTIK